MTRILGIAMALKAFLPFQELHFEFAGFTLQASEIIFFGLNIDRDTINTLSRNCVLRRSKPW